MTIVLLGSGFFPLTACSEVEEQQPPFWQMLSCDVTDAHFRTVRNSTGVVWKEGEKTVILGSKTH